MSKSKPISMSVTSITYEHTDADSPSNTITVEMRVGDKPFFITLKQDANADLKIVDSTWGPAEAIPLRAKDIAYDAIAARELEIAHRTTGIVFATPAQERYLKLLDDQHAHPQDRDLQKELDVQWRTMTHAERVMLRVYLQAKLGDVVGYSDTTETSA